MDALTKLAVAKEKRAQGDTLTKLAVAKERERQSFWKWMSTWCLFVVGMCVFGNHTTDKGIFELPTSWIGWIVAVWFIWTIISGLVSSLWAANNARCEIDDIIHPEQVEQRETEVARVVTILHGKVWSEYEWQNPTHRYNMYTGELTTFGKSQIATNRS